MTRTEGLLSFDGHGLNAYDGRRITKVCHRRETEDGCGIDPLFLGDSLTLLAGWNLLTRAEGMQLFTIDGLLEDAARYLTELNEGILADGDRREIPKVIESLCDWAMRIRALRAKFHLEQTEIGARYANVERSHDNDSDNSGGDGEEG